MSQLTVKELKASLKGLPDNTIIYIGDDEELNGIHEAYYSQDITEEEVDNYSRGSLNGKGGLLIS